ncbi:Uncharacterised protein [Vibrio cholerae]|nr:Uncharacterised protein [Vibrio cholerae]
MHLSFHGRQSSLLKMHFRLLLQRPLQLEHYLQPLRQSLPFHSSQ